MKWRWLIYDHIPTELNVPKAQRRAIRKNLLQSWYMLRSPRRMLAFIIGIVAFSILLNDVFHAINYLHSHFLSIGLPLLFILLLVFGLCLFAGLYGSLLREKTYHLLRQYDYDICKNCGYLLKGLPEEQDRCPECGNEVRKPNPA